MRDGVGEGILLKLARDVLLVVKLCLKLIGLEFN